MFEYKDEAELQEHIINNFNKFFDFDFIGSEVEVSPGRIGTNGKMDLLGEDAEHVYIIELKKDKVKQSTLDQLDRYISHYQTDKIKIGIAVAPIINNNLDFTKYNTNLKVKELNNVIFENMQVITITVTDEMHEKLRKESFETGVSMNMLIRKQLNKKYEVKK